MTKEMGWCLALVVFGVVGGALNVSDYWVSFQYWKQQAEMGYKTPIVDGVMQIIVASIMLARIMKGKRKG